MLLQKTGDGLRLVPRNIHRVDFLKSQHPAGRQPPRAANQHVASVHRIFLHHDGLEQTVTGDGLRQRRQRFILPKARRNHAAVDIGCAQAHELRALFL